MRRLALATTALAVLSLAMPVGAQTDDPVLAIVNGAPIKRSDLQAGYLPSEHLGHIGRWVSDQRRSFLLGSRTESA